MQIRSWIGGLRRSALNSLFRREVSIHSDTPFVTFSFDDFPKSAYTVGGSILKDHGVRGTYFAAIAHIDTVTDVGLHFSMGDLHNLVRDGHELASHTFSHLSAREVPLAEFRQDMQKGYDSLVREFGCEVSRNFSFPYGDVTLAAKRKIAPSFSSCRGIHPGLNWPTADLNLLRANRIYGGACQSRRLESLIEENARLNSWLIFYTHDVCDQPSPYGCTPDLFEKVVGLALASGARVATISEVMQLACPVYCQVGEAAQTT